MVMKKALQRVWHDWWGPIVFVFAIISMYFSRSAPFVLLAGYFLWKGFRPSKRWAKFQRTQEKMEKDVVEMKKGEGRVNKELLDKLESEIVKLRNRRHTRMGNEFRSFFLNKVCYGSLPESSVKKAKYLALAAMFVLFWAGLAVLFRLGLPTWVTAIGCVVLGLAILPAGIWVSFLICGVRK